jgi:hypothetical protein
MPLAHLQGDSMKYRTTQPFIAFGKTCEPGDVVELTEEQAALLAGNDCVVPYEIKIMPKPENKTKKKPTQSALLRPVPRPRKKTRKRSKRKATK